MNHTQTVLPYTRDPIYHVGTSSGKDSVGTMLWALHRSGLPRHRLRFTFCDTGNEDPLTYAHILWLQAYVAQFGLTIETLHPQRPFFELAFFNGRFPARVAQFCTKELKIEPTRAWLRDQWTKGEDVVLINGKRLGESAERSRTMADQPERGFSDFWGCEEWTPLRDWSLEDVMNIHREFKVPLNPLYALGAHRVGCWPCINCGKPEIRLVAKHRPEKIDQIEAEEKRFQSVGRVCTFFDGKTTTARFKDLTYRDSEGRDWPTASIRKVVEWAHTKHGGKVNLTTEELAAPVVCSVKYLACE